MSSEESEELLQEKYRILFDKVFKEHKEREKYLKNSTKPEFTEREKKIMIYYLIINDCIPRAKGLEVWKNMIKEGYLDHRTYNSIWNHFTKFLLPNIYKYNLPDIYEEEFRRLQVKSKRK